MLFAKCRHDVQMGRRQLCPVRGLLIGWGYCAMCRRVLVFYLNPWAVLHHPDYTAWLASLPGQQVLSPLPCALDNSLLDSCSQSLLLVAAGM